MNRKMFLSSAIGMGAVIAAPARVGSAAQRTGAIIPPYLNPGDTVGITAPAGFITPGELQPAMEQMTGWGYKMKLGNTIGKRYLGFGGTDNERAEDMQRMLDDASVNAIMCARGGYGVIRIIDKLDFKNFVKRPKWIIGFSDVTVLHSHLNKLGFASIHSKMCNSFPEMWSLAEEAQKATILSIHQALDGTPTRYDFNASPHNKPGIGQGQLVGGNLKMLETLAGTDSDIDTKGKILFVEDTGEYLYSIDRMFWNLQRTGKLNGLNGLIVGGFRIRPDDPGEEFGISLQQIVMDKVRRYDYPVCFDFPVGHQRNNFALKTGVTHKLVVSTACTLEELS